MVAIQADSDNLEGEVAQPSVSDTLFGLLPRLDLYRPLKMAFAGRQKRIETDKIANGSWLRKAQTHLTTGSHPCGVRNGPE